MLPILHLNGYKIANPTLLARIPEDELEALMRGYGYEPLFVSIGADDEHADAHRRFAGALDEALDRIAEIQRAARDGGATERPRWPMIVLRSPKGWTGPKEVDGLPMEGTWRSHQVPMTDVRSNADHLRLLERVDAQLPARRSSSTTRAGSLPRWPGSRPRATRRMSANPHANGGLLLRDLVLPDFRDYALEVEQARRRVRRVDARPRRASSAT